MTFGWDKPPSRPCALACIFCHLQFEAEWGRPEVTCSHCGNGWGPDWKGLEESIARSEALRDGRAALQDQAVQDHVTGPPPPVHQATVKNRAQWWSLCGQGGPLTTSVDHVTCPRCIELRGEERPPAMHMLRRAGGNESLCEQSALPKEELTTDWSATTCKSCWDRGETLRCLLFVRPTPPRAPAERGSPGGPDFGPVLTDAKLDEICAHIEKTIPIDWAARLCDVSPETLTYARKKSAAVADRIEKARAKGGAALIQLAHTDANNGRSIARSQWLGACLYPKTLNPAQVSVLVGHDGGPVDVAHHDGEKVRPRWMLEFFRKNARWPTAEEHPTEEDLKR